MADEKLVTLNTKIRPEQKAWIEIKVLKIRNQGEKTSEGEIVRKVFDLARDQGLI